MQNQWYSANVAQGILIIQNRVLLVANNYGYANYIWSLPGGRQEPGEQLLETVVREFKEETGLDVLARELLYLVDSRTPRTFKQYFTSVFRVELATPADQLPSLDFADDLDVKDARWVAFPETASLMTSPSLGEGLVNYLYYGAEKLPRRYWHYPDYLDPALPKLSWPPRPVAAE